MKKISRIFVTAYLCILELVLKCDHSLVFHSRVGHFGNTDLFFYPGVFAKIFFQHFGISFFQLNNFSSLCGIFFEHIKLDGYFVIVDSGVFIAHHFVFTNIKYRGIPADGIIGFPVIGFFVFGAAYFLQ